MEKVRVAAVRYLNTLPLIHGLEKLAAVELLPTVPARIAPMVLEREAEVGLVSIADAAGAPLAILPAGMIGCDGPTLTVRLFSPVPLDRVETIHADTDSRTSVILCQVLLVRLHGARPRVLPYHAREHMSRATSGHGAARAPGPAEAILLIGDKVVTDPPDPAQYPVQLDLGQAWKDLTGLPFVYAAWACRSSDTHAPGIASAAELLDRQRRRNAQRLGWIAERFAGEHRWPVDLARRYLADLLRYELGDRERDAIGRFLGEAASLGLVPGDTITWAEPAAASIA